MSMCNANQPVDLSKLNVVANWLLPLAAPPAATLRMIHHSVSHATGMGLTSTYGVYGFIGETATFVDEQGKEWMGVSIK